MYLYSRSSNRNPESQAKAVPVQSLQILSDVMNNIGFRGTRVYCVLHGQVTFARLPDKLQQCLQWQGKIKFLKNENLWLTLPVNVNINMMCLKIALEVHGKWQSRSSTTLNFYKKTDKN